jgi:hypothetical protein
MLYDNHKLVTDGLPFPELKKRALIDKAAIAANDDPDFSRLIREGRPGFTMGSTPRENSQTKSNQ